MENENIKMLRYNTGTDKKAFIRFKGDFDAVIFNATIVSYSGAAIADLVSMYKNQYIIDPQTHIMQHDITALMSRSKKDGFSIKKSVRKYLEQMPPKVLEIIENEGRHLTISEIGRITDELVEKVYDFETNYVNNFIREKEYDKYLKYVQVGPQPKVIIAPYFMIKKDMSNTQIEDTLCLNYECANSFIGYQNKIGSSYPVALQLVMDKEILRKATVLNRIGTLYNDIPCEYVFVWISEFNSWDCSLEDKQGFYKLISIINSIGKKPLMAYGGYDSIFLCNKEINSRIFGVAQSVGYGEMRAITPVGGGLPVNKYYFGPLHRRMRFDEAVKILSDSGYFSGTKTNANHAEDYYSYICNCEKCHEIIGNDIDNFNIYNDSIPYIVKARYGDIARNRPTPNATLTAAIHFLYRKKMEWNEVENCSLSEIKDELVTNYELYGENEQVENIKEWCDIFAR